MQLILDTSKIEDYRTFLKVRALPSYEVRGHLIEIPDEFSHLIGMPLKRKRQGLYVPSRFLFDYQADVSKLAIRKRKFAAFIECGLGKTLIMLEFAKYAKQQIGESRNVLIVSPLMVIEQTIAEAHRFYGDDLPIQQIRAADLQEWLNNGTGIAITNYESMTQELTRGRLGALLCDEGSLLKNHYGKWGNRIIDLGRGLEWKLILTGTPAPNDRIEFANHAVFLDTARTVNEFLGCYFVNRGQTNERWEMKGHALEPFYRNISNWCIFLSNPATYGWKDNASSIPPIRVHIDHVDLTTEQYDMIRKTTGQLVVGRVGGIASRSKLSQIAKGGKKGERIATNKTQFIRDLADSWPTESTIIWCRYNEEQDQVSAVFPEAGNISGDTPHEKRKILIDEFRSGQRRILISKPDILGFGLNLQIATRHIFSTIQDSYEEFWQCVKRSNRVGSTVPLDVHLPVTEVEEPMMQNVLRKAERVQQDTEEQERIYLKNNIHGLKGNGR